MESIHKLIKIRGANRSMATKLEQEALELLSEPGEPQDDERICRLETILELLDSKLKELKLFDYCGCKQVERAFVARWAIFFLFEDRPRLKSMPK